MADLAEPWMLSRRQYLVLKTMEGGCLIFVATEAVDSTALAHPEWDMTEVKSWQEWEEGYTP